MDVRSFLVIVILFWTYATLSAVLYVYGIDTHIARELGDRVQEPLFAPWTARVLQYSLLLAPLLGCYWWSLKLGWQPRAYRIPAQLALACGFALLAYPALTASYLFGLSGKSHSDRGYESLFTMIEQDALVWVASFTDFLVRYGFGLALVTGFAVYKRYRDAELRVAALEQQWGAARLAALRLQLSPHTLFNLLHTIRGYITWDPAAAQAMVVQLADLLRRLLRAGESDFSTLEQELQFVRLYLELQGRRFAERLRISLPDSDGLPRTWVPSLILQPLIENAVAHGLTGHDGVVTVTVTVETEADQVRLTVINDKAAGGGVNAEGVGLRNVRERLAVQFGTGAALSAGPVGEAKWHAMITVPVLHLPPVAIASH